MGLELYLLKEFNQDIFSLYILSMICNKSINDFYLSLISKQLILKSQEFKDIVE